MTNPADYIDTEKYPINRQSSSQFQDLLTHIHTELDADGCAVLKGFIKPNIVKALIKEADLAAPSAHNSKNHTNPYFTKDDESLPKNHPKRMFYERSNAFIPADNFRSNSILRQIYEWKPFFDFVRLAVNEDKEHFHRYADPLADVIINMADEGNGFPWHFDTNNFTVTLAIQNADAGGDFDYAPNIRKGSENFAEVQKVLEGTSDKITNLHLEPGDLQIFKGRYSLHRVAPLKGSTPRYVAIFSYVEKEGMVGSPERTKQLYGKVLPIHLERAGHRADEYLD